MSVQSLLETDKDFAQKFNRRLVFESSKVVNPFTFIAGLISKGVLSDGTYHPEASLGLKETMVQLALMIACSKGAVAMKGLIEAFEESGNSQLISSLNTWIMEEVGIEVTCDRADSNALTPKSEAVEDQVNIAKKLNSSATKLIDKIMLRVDNDFMEQLERQFIRHVSKIVNNSEFCSNFANEMMLDEVDIQRITRPEPQEGQSTKNAIRAACSKRAIASLVLALQSSNNEGILRDIYEWLETSPARKKNDPISIKSLAASQRSKEDFTSVRCAFFEQAALSNGLSKLATFKYQQKSSTTGTIGAQFDKTRLMACSTDGNLHLWNWRDNEEDSIQVAVNVKNITQFQYDEEILILGTAEGAVHLFHAKTYQEKSSVGLGDPVAWLKFAESAIIVITRRADHETLWWMEVSRPDMRILNPRSQVGYLGFMDQIPGACMFPDISFAYRFQLIFVYDTKSGRVMLDEKKNPWLLLAPDHVTSLNVCDLIATKRVVVAGCIDGMIAMWNTSKYRCNQHPNKTFRGHTEAVVSLCSLKGHLLSLDKSGRLLMWSGHEVESKKAIPVSRVLLMESNMTNLVGHDRWFGSGSSKDDVINIWTVPDLWLRTG